MRLRCSDMYETQGVAAAAASIVDTPFGQRHRTREHRSQVLHAAICWTRVRWESAKEVLVPFLNF
jgi:hypothetical protein